MMNKRTKVWITYKSGKGVEGIQRKNEQIEMVDDCGHNLRMLTSS